MWRPSKESTFQLWRMVFKDTVVIRASLDERAVAVVTGATGLEPATSGVTGRRSNQLNYAPGRAWPGAAMSMPQHAPRRPQPDREPRTIAGGCRAAPPAPLAWLTTSRSS